jgi:hypothetical protein
MSIHICPVCRRRHTVHPILDALSWGRQFTCCPNCKAEWRRSALGRNLAELDIQTRQAEREQMERHRHMEEND